MNSNTVPPFKIDCPSCSVVEEFSDFEEARAFVDKHWKHTEHEMEWARADFPAPKVTMSRWKISCETCEDAWQFESPDAAEEFKNEHGEVTDHEISSGPEEMNSDLFEDGGLTVAVTKEVISKVEAVYEDGAPIQSVCAVLSKNGVAVEDTLDQIHNLRMKGEAYEAKQQHLRLT